MAAGITLRAREADSRREAVRFCFSNGGESVVVVGCAVRSFTALSRDDSGRFLPTYVQRGLMDDDPFVTIDTGGVGALIRMGIQNGRKTNRDLKVGICGEHGGEPRSIAFCHEAGLDYVSCSPYRVPIARLAAAQAAVARRGG